MENLLCLGVPVLKHIMVDVTVKGFYVMVKALSGKLSCTWTSLMTSPLYSIRKTFINLLTDPDCGLYHWYF